MSRKKTRVSKHVIKLDTLAQVEISGGKALSCADRASVEHGTFIPFYGDTADSFIGEFKDTISRHNY